MAPDRIAFPPVKSHIQTGSTQAAHCPCETRQASYKLESTTRAGKRGLSPGGNWKWPHTQVSLQWPGELEGSAEALLEEAVG